MQLHNFVLHNDIAASEELLEQFYTVSDLVDELEKLIKQLYPNMCDYYSLGDAAKPAFDADVISNREQLSHLSKIQDWALSGAATVIEQKS